MKRIHKKSPNTVYDSRVNEKFRFENAFSDWKTPIGTTLICNRNVITLTVTLFLDKHERHCTYDSYREPVLSASLLPHPRMQITSSAFVNALTQVLTFPCRRNDVRAKVIGVFQHG